MVIEPNKNYITADGYVIQFGDFFQSKNRVPYITQDGLDCTEQGAVAIWRENGNIGGVTQEWTQKLQIVQKFTLPIPQLPEGYRWKDNFIQYRLPLKGEQYLAVYNKYADTEFNIADHDYHHNSYFIVEKIENVESSQPIKKEEEVMKVNPVVAKSASVTFWAAKKLTNYWLVEPALNIFRPIVKSIRYAIFLSVLSGGGYAYYHPEVVGNFIKSCIPKITIEAPEILKDSPTEV